MGDLIFIYIAEEGDLFLIPNAKRFKYKSKWLQAGFLLASVMLFGSQLRATLS